MQTKMSCQTILKRCRPFCCPLPQWRRSPAATPPPLVAATQGRATSVQQCVTFWMPCVGPRTRWAGCHKTLSRVCVASPPVIRARASATASPRIPHPNLWWVQVLNVCALHQRAKIVNVQLREAQQRREILIAGSSGSCSRRGQHDRLNGMLWECSEWLLLQLFGHVSRRFGRCAEMCWQFPPAHLQCGWNDQRNGFAWVIWQEEREVPFFAFLCCHLPVSIFCIQLCEEDGPIFAGRICDG